MLKTLKRAPRVYDKILREMGMRTRPFHFNEAVNFDLSCILIAVPKTGTTTVRSQIRKAGDFMFPEPHLNAMQVRRGLYAYFLKQALKTNTSFPSKGVPTDAELVEASEAVFRDFFKFSAVRNPWARTASIYARAEGLQLRDTMSFSQFCDQLTAASDTCSYPTWHKNQADWLVDDTGEICMDYVYKVEDAANAFAEIRERTEGRVQLEAVHRNVNPNSKSATYQDLYDDASKAAIGRLFEKDIDLFKYAF
ncbi:MAG: sulfotransferase family 2 domain-containing protein [Pseudomonadota bacterium]